jgi:hypothetical protein
VPGRRGRCAVLIDAPLSPDLAARLLDRLDRLGGIVPLGCGALIAGAPAALPGDTA